MKREFWSVRWTENGSPKEEACPNHEWAWALVGILRGRGHVVSLRMELP